MERYLKAITIAFFIIGIIGVISGTIVLLQFNTGLFDNTWISQFIINKGLSKGEALRKMIIFLPMLIASVGLHFRMKWGRIVAILWSIFNIADFPIGTVFGIIALWVLLKKETKKMFKIEESSFI